MRAEDALAQWVRRRVDAWGGNRGDGRDGCGGRDGRGGGSEVWDVTVTQQYPDGRVTEYAQEITTRRGETGHLITQVDSK